MFYLPGFQKYTYSEFFVCLLALLMLFYYYFSVLVQENLIVHRLL